MTAQVVACPQCGTNLQNSEAIAGQVVACPNCQTQLQMPPLSQPVPAQSSVSDELPPALDLPPQVAPGAEAVPPGNSSPIVQTPRQAGKQTSVSKRLKKKSNPLLILFIVFAILALIGIGTAGVLWDQSQKAKKDLAAQIIGNWELIPGQAQLNRWDFAFHADGKLQMALGTTLSDGRWRVISAQKSFGEVLISWPDDAPETMRVRFDGDTMQVELASVGNYDFRAAVP